MQTRTKTDTDPLPLRRKLHPAVWWTSAIRWFQLLGSWHAANWNYFKKKKNLKTQIIRRHFGQRELELDSSLFLVHMTSDGCCTDDGPLGFSVKVVFTASHSYSHFFLSHSHSYLNQPIKFPYSLYQYPRHHHSPKMISLEIKISDG